MAETLEVRQAQRFRQMTADREAARYRAEADRLSEQMHRIEEMPGDSDETGYAELEDRCSELMGLIDAAYRKV